MKKHLAVAVAVWAVGFSAVAVSAQTEQPQAMTPSEAEITPDVPELSAFHEVIYPLWHTAYPAQDTTMMRTLWPDIVKHEAAVQKAELPGILRDKKEAWQKGLDALHAAEMRYGAALASGDKEKLLQAAESLHTSFEGLVRVIHPVLPELAAFHEVLYRVYHYDLPQKNLTSLQSHLPALSAAMDTLNGAALPPRLDSRKKDFEKARAQLSEKVTALRGAMKGPDWDSVAKAIEEMHTAYQSVEKIFD